MARFRLANRFNAAMVLLVPSYSDDYGVENKTFPAVDDKGENVFEFFGNFKTYGGTETTVNGAYVVEDTAIIETWYNPIFTSDCRIYVRDNGGYYDILASPENINLEGQYLKMKVRRVKGGA